MFFYYSYFRNLPSFFFIKAIFIQSVWEQIHLCSDVETKYNLLTQQSAISTLLVKCCEVSGTQPILLTIKIQNEFQLEMMLVMRMKSNKHHFHSLHFFWSFPATLQTGLVIAAVMQGGIQRLDSSWNLALILNPKISISNWQMDGLMVYKMTYPS